MAAVPLTQVVGPGVVVAQDKGDGAEIGPADFEAADPGIRTGDIVILSTGGAASWGSPRRDRHPDLSVAAADWLIARPVKMIVTDFVTPDMAFPLRPAGYHSPVHVALLGAGMLSAEQLANPAALAGRRVEVLCAPLPLVGCDGSPVRFLARAVQ